MRIIVFILLLLMPVGAFALTGEPQPPQSLLPAEVPPPPPPAPPPAPQPAPVVEPVVVPKHPLAECQTLAEYHPEAGVAYEPGVSVDGKTVVPADLNAVPFEMPDIMTIPLSFDLARRMPDPPEGMTADASVGFLEVHKNGRITFEGQDWTPQVYAICRGETPPPMEKPEAAPIADDGQTAPTPVESGAIPAPNATQGGGVLIEGGESSNEGYN